MKARSGSGPVLEQVINKFLCILNLSNNSESWVWLALWDLRFLLLLNILGRDSYVSDSKAQTFSFACGALSWEEGSEYSGHCTSRTRCYVALSGCLQDWLHLQKCWLTFHWHFPAMTLSRRKVAHPRLSPSLGIAASRHLWIQPYKNYERF